MDTAPFVPGPVEAIVFDVTGTLVDEDETWASVAERLAAEAGLGQPADLRKRWAELLQQHMNAVIRGHSPWRLHRQLVSDSASEAIRSLGGSPSSATSALASSVDWEYLAWPDVASGWSGSSSSTLIPR